MKRNIHPETRPTIFIDTSCGQEFFSSSTQKSEETREVGGVPYQVVKIEISSASHPFYTGKQMLVDTARRVEKFAERQAKKTAVSAGRKGKKAKRAVEQAKKKALEAVAKPKKNKESAAKEA